MYRSGGPIGFWSAVLLGVGAMVGAGIFALLGQAGSVAGSAVWISFVYGGIAAALSGYSFGRLGARYPSAGGLVEYLVRAYGGGYFAGSAAFLLYFSGLLALALIAKAFGSYACALILGTTDMWVVDVFALTIIAALVWVNLKGAREVATFENVVVIAKVGVLCAFVAIGACYIEPGRLSIASYPDQRHIAAAIGFTFFAFEGFRVITNTAEDMTDPERLLPRAMITSIAIVAVLYVLLSLVVFGNLDVQAAIDAKDYALAQAAAPVFGATGFVVVGIVAMISTASAINANLYAVTNVTYKMATDGELPAAFGRPVAHSREGLLISSAIVAVLVPSLDLSALAVIGSLTILLVHIAVHVGHWRLLGETGASRLLLALAILGNTAVVLVVVAFEFGQSPYRLFYLLAFVVAALLLEALFRRLIGRDLGTRGDQPGAGAS
ncbi:MAG: APC family permease [Pseudomonadales bacterium]